MPHDKTIALVTGANKGIGLEIARQLGKHGFTVILAARDDAKAAEAAAKLKEEGFDAHGIRLDVTRPATIQDAAAWLADRFGRLDVLVNNAGVGPEFRTNTKPSELAHETLRETYETNVFGPVAVIQHMIPLLKKSASGRIVNQSSSLGSLGLVGDPKSPYYGTNVLAYDSSKTALNAVTVAFAKELAADKISVNSCCPGWVKTEMGGEAAPRSVAQGARIAVKLATMENPPTGKFLNDAGEIKW